MLTSLLVMSRAVISLFCHLHHSKSNRNGSEHTFRDVRLMSALVRLMSALPPKADIAERDWNVRFVPKSRHRDKLDCHAHRIFYNQRQGALRNQTDAQAVRIAAR